MAKHLLVVLSNAVPGEEHEFVRWYEEQHLDDMLREPGFVSAQLFKVARDGARPLSGRFLALYEMETDDPLAAYAGLQKAAQAGRLPMTATMDVANVVSTVVSPVSEKKTARRSPEK
jgi:hypothetical protein